MVVESTVLLVEDDADVREALAGVLSKNFNLVVAASGAEAVQIIAGQHVDLLLTDIVMPGMNGFELADQAKSMRPGLRVIYMTGFTGLASDPSRARHGKLVPKPFTPSRMVSEIRSTLAA